MIIDVPRKILERIEEFAALTHIPKEEIIQKALQKYLDDALPAFEINKNKIDFSNPGLENTGKNIPDDNSEIHITNIRNRIAEFNAIYNSITDAIVFSNTERKIILVNPAFTEMFGYLPEEALGRTTLFLYPDEESYIRQREKFKKGDIEGRHIFEVTLKRKNGELFLVETLGIPVKNGQNEIIGYTGIHRDITARKSTEEELNHSVSLLKATLDSTADGILAVDLSGMIKIFNDRFIDLWQIPKNIINSGDNKSTLNFIFNKLKNPRDFILKTEYLFSNRSEESFDILEFKNGVFLESFSRAQLIDGRPAGRVWSFRDITEKIKAEQDLRESEERYRSLYENTPLGLYRTTPDGKILLANPALLRMLNYSSFDELNSRNLENGAFEPHYLRKEFKENIEKYNEIKGFESLWTRWDGSGIYLRENTKALKDADGNILYYEGSVEDITEHKNSEEKIKESELQFRSIWENSFDGMRLLDENGICILVNNAFCKMAEKTKEELEGKFFSIIYSSERQAEINVKHQKLFKSKSIIPHQERNLILWNGKKKWFEVSNSYIELENSHLFLLSIFRDITDRKSSEADRLRLNKLESLGILTGGIVHDFRNILTVIKGQATILQIKIKDADIQKSVSSILEATTLATGLTSRLFSFAQGEMPHKVSVQINELLDDILNSETDKKIKYELHFEEIPTIEADAAQLKQALKNIIINAKEAIPLSGIIIISTKITTEKTSPFLKISISDSGIGIPKENLTKIFDPYFSTKTRADSKGSGLGLSISYSIIKNHGGNIFVDSQTGKGTTFDIFIPISIKTDKTDLDSVKTRP